ncbi:MAG TPA: carbohydrate porin [Kofleriaceae bacterium]|nr:carbohydrate porin [Kofleriaceae bacterium]
MIAGTIGLAVALLGVGRAAADDPPADPADRPADPADRSADRSADPAGDAPAPGDAPDTDDHEVREVAPPPEELPVPEPAVAAPDGETGFRFGSYGRIAAATDLRGGRPERISIVAHGPRVVEPSYLELEFQYGFRAPSGVLLRTVTTVAYDDQLFHETGKFEAGPAIRNLFAEAQWRNGARAWVGSRMVRGDDLYLFDYWPLDDDNTVAAGGSLVKGKLTVEAHVGVNRLLDPFQFQEVDVAAPEQGATTIVQLNRQRMIGSTTIAYIVDGPARRHAMVKLHAQLHGLPAGDRRRATDQSIEHLPDDWGTTLGLELGAWTDPDDDGRSRHLNLFARWSKGLAAYDELAPPTSFGTDLRTFPRASELVLGAGMHADAKPGNVVAALYARRFVDADPVERDPDDGWEYAIDARPLAKVRGDLHAGVDLSYQVRFPRGLDPLTGLAADPAVVQVAPMLVYSPMGPSAFARPQLRVVYRAAHLNDAALGLYAEEDPRRDHAWVHYLGVQAEWWFNSSSYR